MCENLKLPNGAYCETVGQLRKALYPKKIIQYDDADRLRENDCLCCVNFKALAEREGWALEFDCGDTIATAI